MSVHPIYGELVIAPTGANTGGTVVNGLQNGPNGYPLVATVVRNTRFYRIGRKRTERVAVAEGDGIVQLAVALRDVNMTVITSLLEDPAQDGGIGPGVTAWDASNTVALLVRPSAPTSDEYLYIPAAACADLAWAMQYGDGQASALDGQTISFEPVKPATDVPAWFMGSAGEVNALYFGG